MTAVLVGSFVPGSPEWIEERRTHLGGSEIAAVLGLSPFESRFSLWHRKAGLVDGFEGNRFTDWGQRLEPVIGQKFLEEHPEMTTEHLTQRGMFVHADRPWQSASPDLYLHDRNSSIDVMQWAETFCEIKTAARGDAWYDGVPVYYRCQVLWTMDVLSVQRAYLAALIGGSDYREYVIDLDDDAEADLVLMRQAGEQFMADLAENRAPDIDDSYATFQAVRRLHPDIELDAEHEVDRDVAEAYLAANQMVATAEKLQRGARTAIARHMKNAQYAVCEGVRIARRQPARDGGAPVLVSTRKHLPELLKEAS